MGVSDIPVTWLKRNKGCGHPSELGYIGCTSYNIADPKSTGLRREYLRYGILRMERMSRDGVTSRQSTVPFTQPLHFWDAVIGRGRKRTPLWLFAHDWPEIFTLTGGWMYLRQGQLGFESHEVRYDEGCEPPEKRRKWKGLFIDGDPPVVMQLWTRRGCKIFLVDVRNYFPHTIDDLAKRLDRRIPWAPDGYKVTMAVKMKALGIVEVVRKSITGLIDGHRKSDQGNWALTAAGLAWRSFRHRHYSGCISMHHLPEVKKLERDGYYGGRVEAFRLGKIDKPCVQLDVNGLYPWVMQTFDLPCQLVDSWSLSPQNKPSPKDVTEDHICEVKLCAADDVFPVRLGRRGLCFCRGVFTTTLCGPELVRASRAGAIVAIGRWARYKRWRWGKKHVEYWQGRRLEAKADNDPIGDAYANSQMHCLYGRFGMRSFRWSPLSDEIALPNELAQLSTKEVMDWIWLTEGDQGQRISIVGDPELGTGQLRRVGNHWELAKEPEEIPGSLPAICAWITAYARERMRYVMQLAGSQATHYISTDSVICSAAGHLSLSDSGMLHPVDLGKLKIEADGNGANILGIHRYSIGNKRVNSSQPKAVPWVGDPGTTEVVSDGLATFIKTGQSRTVNRRLITVSRKSGYSRGIVRSDGCVEPYVL